MATPVKNPDQLNILKPSRRDSFIQRGLNDQEIKNYGKDIHSYTDDELKEMLGYVFDDYQFDDSDDDDDTVYSRFYDKVLDRYGGLSYERGSNGKQWSYPSYWGTLSSTQKEDELDSYLNAINSRSWWKDVKDPLYLTKLDSEARKRIADEYKAQYNREYKGTPIDRFIEEFHRTPVDKLPFSIEGWSDDQIKLLLDLARKSNGEY